MINKEFEKYNKKYRNGYRLLKYSKKEVERFDKLVNKDLIKTKNYLLKGRKWVLIDDSYYEIPKKFTYNWFRNLRKGYQIAISVLLGGALTSAVAVPTVTIIAIENSKNRHIVKDINYCNFKYGTVRTKGHFFSKNPNVFYVPVIEYNDYAPESLMRVLDVDDDYVELKNLKSIDPSKKAKLNLKTGELTYSSYSYFTDTSGSLDGRKFPHQEIYFTGFKSKDVYQESKIINEGHEYSINLSDYDLKPIKDGNTYYMPMDVLMAIDPTITPSTAYCCEDTVQVIDSQLPYAGLRALEYPSSFYKWCYDLFTFNVDLNFGLSGYRRYQRNNNSYFTYNKEGARKTFEPYKSKLISSKSIKEFDITFDRMINEQLDDGGHTVTYFPSFVNVGKEFPSSFMHAKESGYTDDKLLKEKDARASAGEDQQFAESVCSFDADGDDKKDIGYFCFNGFNEEAGESLMEANKAFNKNNGGSKDIKDVVIDIANNGGGSVGIEGAILSWICGGKATQILKDAHDESVVKSVFSYDINTDKTYDEKDYLPDDVHIYILTDASFSAASALAFDTYMYSKSSECPNEKKITFIGQPHLGGACSVTGVMLAPTGFGYRLSSTAVSVDWYDHSKTCDEQDFMYIDNDWNLTLDEIVNRTGVVNKRIVKARGQ